jgi:hypothetical protein
MVTMKNMPTEVMQKKKRKESKHICTKIHIHRRRYQEIKKVDQI